MRKKLIVANWKSNKNPQEANLWLDEFVQITKDKALTTNDLEVVICPPYPDLPTLNYKLTVDKFPFPISLGAQDVSPFDSGSYTGAVSASQLKGLVNFALVGHSERRKYFGETTQSVTSKANLLLREKIRPIICARSQEDIPVDLKNYSAEEIIIMFEPASAISINGQYQTEDPNIIKTTIDLWQKELGPYQFLYGGSVNPENAAVLLKTGVEGFVIGHASLSPETFYQILKNVC